MKPNTKKSIKYKFSELASRITGISIPIFGVSWNPPESERKIIRSLLIFLEDRRALYNPNSLEIGDHVVSSVIEIRENLTDSIQRLPEKSDAIRCLRAMRAACREYLDKQNDKFGFPHHKYLIDLGRLRTVFGYYIAQLAIMYGIDIEGDLAQILPPEYVEDLSIDK